MQRRHLLLALAAATLVTAHQAAGAADDQEKKMPNADAADSAETEFCAAASSGLEFNEQGKLLLKTKCTAVKSRCEKNSCQKQCKLACGAC